MRKSHKRSLGNLRRGIQMDIDEVHAILADPDQRAALSNQPIDIDQIGMAQHYCLECAQYFENEHALIEHAKGSKHKRRVKLLKEIPYSHEEADLATGINSSKSKYALRNAKPTKKEGDVVMAQ